MTCAVAYDSTAHFDLGNEGGVLPASPPLNRTRAFAAEEIAVGHAGIGLAAGATKACFKAQKGRTNVHEGLFKVQNGVFSCHMRACEGDGGSSLAQSYKRLIRLAT